MQKFSNKVRSIADNVIIIYNRVPKCGSRAVIDVLQRLGKQKNITYYHSPHYKHFKLSVKQQVDFAYIFAKLSALIFTKKTRYEGT